MKNCPFCKKEIPNNSEKCIYCGRTLIEKISSVHSTSNQNHDNPPKEKTHTYKAYKTTSNPSSSPKKNFELPKGSGWIISIVGSILLSVILSNIGASSNPLPAPNPSPTTALDTNPETVPAPIPDISYYSLPNGTVLYNSLPQNALGTLTISNGSSSDAVVKLITTSGQKVYSVYVQKNNSFTIKNITDGNYRLLFVFGYNWDKVEQKFLLDPSAQSFNDTFNFKTTNTESDTEYSTYEITLNPVVGGTAETNPIDIGEFNNY